MGFTCLLGASAVATLAQGPCKDPWIGRAVIEASAGTASAQTSTGEDGDCDISKYKNGNWRNYPDLVEGIRERRNQMYRMNREWEAYTFRVGGVGYKSLALMDTIARKPIILSLVGNDGASLIGTDSAGMQPIIAKMVAAGGGNMVAAGGGNLKSLVRMVAAGGGNISPDVIKRSIIAAGVQVSLPPNFSLLSVEDKAKTFKVGSRVYKVQ